MNIFHFFHRFFPTENSSWNPEREQQELVWFMVWLTAHVTLWPSWDLIDLYTWSRLCWMDVCGSETKDRRVRKSEACYLKLDTSHHLSARTPVMSLNSLWGHVLLLTDTRTQEATRFTFTERLSSCQLREITSKAGTVERENKKISVTFNLNEKSWKCSERLELRWLFFHSCYSYNFQARLHKMSFYLPTAQLYICDQWQHFLPGGRKLCLSDDGLLQQEQKLIIY